MQKRSEELGLKPIPQLLLQQAVPASIGILIMAIYGIVDTIFVGRWVGPMGIAAVTVVYPITFLISSIGMAIGVGGGSVISRAMGAGDTEKANHAFGNQAGLTLGLSILISIIGYVFMEPVLSTFGAKNGITAPAIEYFSILLPSIPFLAWAMMSNNVIRSEGKPRMAMITLVIPAIANIILDPILIAGFGMGIKGAAYATAASYFASAMYTLWYFGSGRSELSLKLENMRPDPKLVQEIFGIGFVTLARQGAISLLAIVLNNSLVHYGTANSVAVFGLIRSVLMFANFPVLGLMQGFLPITGYNYGAGKTARVQKVIWLAIRSGTAIAFGIFALIMIFAEPILSIFTTDASLLDESVPALRKVFLATPLLSIQLLGSAYFQAIGKAIPALLLALTKQGFCLIPLLLILPRLFEATGWFPAIEGVWWAFPIADVLTATLSFGFLQKEMGRLRQMQPAESIPEAV